MDNELPGFPLFFFRWTVLLVAALVLFYGSAWATRIELPRTGQTACYDESGASTACAGTGQDGELRKGVPTPVPRFNDNGDGTVTDNLTGLVWLKNANCFWQVPWLDAIAAARDLHAGQCGLADASQAGDWRLPNILELESLIDIGQVDPALPAGHPFLSVLPGGYWSSTTNAFHPSRARFVYMPHGAVNGSDKTNTQSVWPVRGGR